jgi:hypothetical protein
VVLRRSAVEGPPLRLATDRRYLLRALKLGFREVAASRPDQPLLCRDERRTYLWMPLDASGAIPPTPGRTRRQDPMPTSNGSQPEDQPTGPASNVEPPDPLAEAEALRVLLQEAALSAGRLVGALKQQRRRGRSLEAALASLRQLGPHGL